MKQRTLSSETSITGKALHTGEEVSLTLKPAPVGTGLVFRRVDMKGSPELPARIADVEKELVRSTDISSGHAKVHTVEHVLSALTGSGVDNAYIELTASEPPIMDGSARPFAAMIKEAGIEEQDAEREVFTITEPAAVSRGTSSLIALPYDGFKITCTSSDDRGIHTQHLSLDIDPEVYLNEIASARTFTIYEDIEELIKMGKIKGGSLDSAIVIKGDKVISKDPLRFEDEFVRHKILDVIGDLSLLGRPIKGHIVAVRTGHALNAQLTQKLAEQLLKQEQGKKKSDNAQAEAKVSSEPGMVKLEPKMDIRRIMDVLPHRYPFLLVDRVLDVKESEEEGYSVTVLKNVTLNEPYFQGHFPGQPVMPGVLQLEAMAQAAGLLMLRHVSPEGKVAFFLSADKVKFRRLVQPGDQLIITVMLTKTRGRRIAAADAECKVDGKVVSSASLMFTVVDAEM